MKKQIAAIAAAVCAAIASAETRSAAPAMAGAAREAVKSAAANMEASLRTAGVLDGKNILLFPVQGDAGSECWRRLQSALVSAGKTTIAPDDPDEPVFKRILGSIEKAERDVKGIEAFASADAQTTQLGKLKNAHVLMFPYLTVSPRSRNRASAEIYAIAYEIATKQIIWTGTFESGCDGDTRSVPAASDAVPAPLPPSAVNVKTAVRAADAESTSLASAVAVAARGELVKMGYTVDGAGEADVELTLEVSREAFDKTGGWFVFDGEVSAKAVLCGANARLLGSKTLDAHGERGLGASKAEKSLVSKLSAEVAAWVGESVAPSALGLVSQTFPVEFVETETAAGDLLASERFRRGVEAAKGVRSVSVVSRSVSRGTTTVVFRAIYEKALYRGGLLAGVLEKNPALANLMAE